MDENRVGAVLKLLVVDPSVRRLAVLFLLTRLALLLAGLVGHSMLPPGPGLTGGNLRVEHNAPVGADIWARWDSEWYLLIAERGYDVGDALVDLPIAYDAADATGFFPLYPFAIRCLAPITGNIGAGILISNLTLLVSLLLILGLARDLWGPGFGTQAGEAAAAALLLFPATVFHSAVYAESVFLMLSLAAVRCAHRDRFVWSGLWAMLAALTRPFGVLLSIPIAIEWWQSRHRSRWGWLTIAAIAAGIGLYMLFCYGLFGDALAFVHRQGRWRGALGFPGLAFIRWWQAGPTLSGAHSSTIELAAALCVLAAIPSAFRRLPRSFALYLTAGVLVPLSSSLWSFTRIASTLFPIYLLIGLAWAEGRRKIPIAYAIVGGTLALIAMTFFAAGWWVG